MSLIRKYDRIDELTAPILNELIESIFVHETISDDGEKTQAIEIIYRFVGKID